MRDSEEFINFEILGEQFTIRSDVPKKYFLGLVKRLEGKVKEIKAKFPNLSNFRTLIFAALDIADENEQIKKNVMDTEELKVISDLSDSLASVINEEQ
jgi:cell division protein ZapA (FtsZ GTPase activity inhibitor)